MKVWLLLGLLLVHEALEDVTGQQPPKNKRPKEPGENRIKPTNKKVKPKIPKIKDRDAADATPKTQSIMIQMLDKGRFQKPAATLSLTAGQTLELRCKGNKIGWSYPAYLDTFKDSRLSVRQHERYGQLTLVNSTAADTGEFSCWGQLCQGYICRKDETKTGSTYIFFTEKGELFVPSPSYFDVVYLNRDRPAVVPCRVTVLSAKVTLHREFPAKEIPANGTDIVYDMKRGFVYLQPHSDQQGVVYCKAEAGGKSQISVKYQLLYVEGTSAPPSLVAPSAFSSPFHSLPFLAPGPPHHWVMSTSTWSYQPSPLTVLTLRLKDPSLSCTISLPAATSAPTCESLTESDIVVMNHLILAQIVAQCSLTPLCVSSSSPSAPALPTALLPSPPTQLGFQGSPLLRSLPAPSTPCLPVLLPLSREIPL
ncbi:platelet-derived growth factor receptor-like protein [Crocuta crocuta]